MFVLKLQKLLQTKKKEVRETGLLSCIILKREKSRVNAKKIK